MYLITSALLRGAASPVHALFSVQVRNGNTLACAPHSSQLCALQNNFYYHITASRLSACCASMYFFAPLMITASSASAISNASLPDSFSGKSRITLMTGCTSLSALFNRSGLQPLVLLNSESNSLTMSSSSFGGGCAGSFT